MHLGGDRGSLQIPGFEIEAEVGRGGMGIVYRARHLQLNRLVALKIMRTGQFATAEERLRFEFEAELAARIRHRNVVQVYEAGRCGDMAFLVTEYLAGGTLAGLLQGRPHPPRQAATWLADLASGVAAAHRQGVLHRDLKPANVLVDTDGTLKITDFGLAKRMEDAARLTSTGMVVGTPAYMAPEHTDSTQTLTAAADVYSLGVILFETLTGRLPFNPDDPIDVLLNARTNPAPSPRQFQPRVPRDLETICLKCLEKSPDRRYPTAEDLAADLRNYLAMRPISARPVAMVERVGRWCWRNPMSASLAAALVLTLAMGLIVALTLYCRAEERRHAAELAQNSAEAAWRLAEGNRQRAQAAEAEAIDNLRATQLAAEGVLNQFLDNQRLNLLDSTGLRQELVAAMVPMFEDLAKRQGASSHAEFARAWAYQRLGSLLLEMRQIEAACHWLAQAATVLERLYTVEPANVEFGLELAKALTNQGRALVLRDDPAQAAQLTLRANQLLRTIVEHRPDHHAARLALGQNEVNLSQFDAVIAGSVPAQERLQAALEHAAILLKLHPDREEYLYFASVAHTNLGTLLKRQRLDAESKLHLETALRLRGELVDRVPQSLEYRSAQAKAYRNLADLHAERGEMSAALPLIEEALRLQAAIVKEGADLPPYREDLAKIRDSLGIALRKLNRLPECGVHFREAIALRERLIRDRPEVREYVVRLGGSYCNLGNYHRLQRVQEFGIPWFNRAIELLTPLAENRAVQDEARTFLANSYLGRTLANVESGRPAEASADYRAAALLVSAARQPDIEADAAHQLIRAGAHLESLTLMRTISERPARAGTLFFCARKCARAAGGSGLESPLREQFRTQALVMLWKTLACDPGVIRQGWQHPELQTLRDHADYWALCWAVAEAPGHDWLAW